MENEEMRKWENEKMLCAYTFARLHGGEDPDEVSDVARSHVQELLRLDVLVEKPGRLIWRILKMAESQMPTMALSINVYNGYSWQFSRYQPSDAVWNEIFSRLEHFQTL